MDTFKFAGVSKHDGKFKFRATNRDGYDQILIKEGKTNVDIRTMPTPMDKDSAKEYLASIKEFQTAEILAVLTKGAKATVTTVKVAKAKVAKDTKAKAPKAEKGAVVASTKTSEEIEAIKEKNLEVMRQVTAKRKALDEREAKLEMIREQHEAAEAADIAANDIRDVIPKFLHKEMGLA
jgi:hypothetical protein